MAPDWAFVGTTLIFSVSEPARPERWTAPSNSSRSAVSAAAVLPSLISARMMVKGFVMGSFSGGGGNGSAAGRVGLGQQGGGGRGGARAARFFVARGLAFVDAAVLDGRAVQRIEAPGLQLHHGHAAEHLIAGRVLHHRQSAEAIGQQVQHAAGQFLGGGLAAVGDDDADGPAIDHGATTGRRSGRAIDRRRGHGLVGADIAVHAGGGPRQLCGAVGLHGDSAGSNGGGTGAGRALRRIGAVRGLGLGGCHCTQCGDGEKSVLHGKCPGQVEKVSCIAAADLSPRRLFHWPVSYWPTGSENEPITTALPLAKPARTGAAAWPAGVPPSKVTPPAPASAVAYFESATAPTICTPLGTP